MLRIEEEIVRGAAHKDGEGAAAEGERQLIDDGRPVAAEVGDDQIGVVDLMEDVLGDVAERIPLRRREDLHPAFAFLLESDAILLRLVDPLIPVHLDEAIDEMGSKALEVVGVIVPHGTDEERATPSLSRFPCPVPHFSESPGRASARSVQ